MILFFLWVFIGIGVLAASNIPETLGVPALQTFKEADLLYKNSGWCGFKRGNNEDDVNSQKEGEINSNFTQ